MTPSVSCVVISSGSGDKTGVEVDSAIVIHDIVVIDKVTLDTPRDIFLAQTEFTRVPAQITRVTKKEVMNAYKGRLDSSM